MKRRAEAGAFPRLLAAVLFLAVCAYGAAALYGGVLSETRTAVAQQVTLVQSLPLRGIALRRERRLASLLPARWLPEAGARIPAGGLLAELADGSGLYAEGSVLFFPDTDGYEDLSVDRLGELEVAAVQALLDEKPLLRAGTLGRAVSGDDWYFAALAQAAALPEPGSRVELRFPGLDRTVRARLAAVSEAENGQMALLLRLTAGGDMLLSLRKCEAELILSVRAGLELPGEAVQADGDGGHLVYTLTADGAVPVAVERIETGSGHTVVLPEQDSALQPGSRVLLSLEEREG